MMSGLDRSLQLPESSTLKSCTLCGLHGLGKEQLGAHRSSQQHSRNEAIKAFREKAVTQNNSICSINVLNSELPSLKLTPQESHRTIVSWNLETGEGSNTALSFHLTLYIDPFSSVSNDDLELVYADKIKHHEKGKEGTKEQLVEVIHVLDFRIGNAISQLLEPTEPYKVPKWKNRRDPAVNESRPLRMVRGLAIPRVNRDHLQRPDGSGDLNNFSVPLTLRYLSSRNYKSHSSMNSTRRAELAKLNKLLGEKTSEHNHYDRFNQMLFMEELQREVDIRNYDVENAIFTEIPNPYGRNREPLYELEIPGLAESRPSVLAGDRISVPDSGTGFEYQGIIHKINRDTIWVGFGKEWRENFRDNSGHHVRFSFGRTPLKLMHRAIKWSSDFRLNHVLFPQSHNSRHPRKLKELGIVDKKILSNPEQRAAVEAITSGAHSPAPYIVFGPPGTGKTVTLVEAIIQILATSSRARIVACTPSNAAADLLAHRLSRHIGPQALLRLNAISRDPYAVEPQRLLQYSNLRYNSSNQSEEFYYPSKNRFIGLRVTVTTLCTAGRLASACFPPHFFTHVFIDEAGQATEPETLVGIAGLVAMGPWNSKRGPRPSFHQCGKIILAGDPMQLGPVLFSSQAIDGGLGKSLMERLMETCAPYRRSRTGCYDTQFITKLVRNYRSREEILRIPSELFYGNELIPCATEKASLANWETLPKPGFPLLFHGIVGKDQREARSPSFFNPSEAALVIYYIDKLLSTGAVNRRKPEIGIITPYRKQVSKITELLRRDLKKYGNVCVGSVEEFQGAQRRVIIISTVRSNPEFLSTDSDFKLGFLHNPKRFNTAITRAQSLLIIIGNPWILERDPFWNKMLTFCARNEAYCGVPYALKPVTTEKQKPLNPFSLI